MKSKIIKKDKEKRELIDRLSNKGCTLMFFYEESPDEGFPHEKLNDHVTLVPPPYRYEALEKWLYLGNWQAICPPNQHYVPFDTFRTSAVEIQERMNELKIEIIIDSFHDDTEWNVIENTHLVTVYRE